MRIGSTHSSWWPSDGSRSTVTVMDRPDVEVMYVPRQLGSMALDLSGLQAVKDIRRRTEMQRRELEATYRDLDLLGSTLKRVDEMKEAGRAGRQLEFDDAGRSQRDCGPKSWTRNDAVPGTGVGAAHGEAIFEPDCRGRWPDKGLPRLLDADQGPCGRSHRLRNPARRDLRPARSQRIGQEYDDQDDPRSAPQDVGAVDGLRPNALGRHGQEAHRVPARGVLPLPVPESTGDARLLRSPLRA